MSTCSIEFHPLANIFPLLEGDEFESLAADIKANGLHESIVIYEEKILDGRNRYRACQSVDVDPVFAPYLDDDPLAFVISANLRRRHLDESQRAMVAARLANLRDGQRGDLVEGLPIGRASALLNVGERSVARAREVQERGAPELQNAVEQGKVSVSAAADVATEPLLTQQEIVAKGEKEILRIASEIRTRKAQVRHVQRIQKIKDISGGNEPLPHDRKYPVILADPPWSYALFGEDTESRTAASHYPTMSIEEICALPVADLATPHAVIFLWATVPNLPQALDVLKAWSFDYVSHVAWVKDVIGLGYWVRGQHETLIIGRRGDMPPPLPANRPSSVIQAPRRQHSRKPDEAYALIEGMYPDLPKIELFARQRREGWQAWGNQAGGDLMMSVKAPPIAADLDDIPPFLDRTASRQTA